MYFFAFILIFVTSPMVVLAQQNAPQPVFHCPTDPVELAKTVSSVLDISMDRLKSSEATLTFASGDKKDVVVRHSSSNESVSYTSQKLNLTGTSIQIEHDEKLDVQQHRAMALTLENYDINFFQKDPSNPNVYIYWLFPKGEMTGRFLANSKLYIDRSTCYPVRAVGKVAVGPLKASVDTTFQVVNNVLFPKKANLVINFYVKKYELTTSYDIDPSKVVLKDGFQDNSVIAVQMPSGHK